ncbi:oligosaccharide flippase family protein [Roseibium aggregatum]|uniref:Oligosaccharide flippase family protein n=1 Tax=Roseibium aggregatum TaxID=187304 RepID=A0A939ED21_9HYPH|nr:oligosaccharide flippase family protein [Roseibium aggregatum]MBN9669863.1 oligosaccharide flippase family protein [Roseibium aggregatum]
MSLRKSYFFSFSRVGGQGIIQFLANVILARLLAPDEVGLFVLAFALIATFASVRDFGVPRYILMEKDLTYTKMQTAFGIALISGWGLGLCFLLSSHFVADFYGDERLVGVMYVLSATFLFLPFGQIALALLRRNEEHRTLALITLTSSFAGTLVSVALAAWGLGALSMAYGNLCTVMVMVAGALKAVPTHIAMRPSLVNWRPVFGFSALTMIGVMAGQFKMYAPSLLIGRVVGLSATGLYHRAFSVLQFFTGTMITSTNWVTGANIGKRFRAGEDISGIFTASTSFLIAVGWPAYFLIALQAKPIILLLYGPTWLPAAELLPPLCLASATMLMLSQASSIYEGIGASKVFVRNNIIILLIMVLSILFFSQGEIVRIAWIVFFTNIVAAILDLWTVNKIAHIDYLRFAKGISKSVFVSVTTGCLVFAIDAFVPDELEYSIFANFGEIMIFVTSYLVLCYAVKHPILEELSFLINKLRAYLEIRLG